jgi:uncharacterized protein (DUF1697 family)
MGQTVRPRSMAGKTRQIALLRGINLGSRRRVAMADLRELVSRLGYEDVRTHLQSGNVVLTAGETPRALGRKLELEIERVLGLDVQVVVRTRDELAQVSRAIRSATWSTTRPGTS